MRGRTVAAALVLGLIAACGGDQPEPASTPSPTPLPSPTPTPAPSPSPSPSPEPSPSPDGDAAAMPASFGPDLEPAEVPAAKLIPRGADLTGQWFGFTDDGVVIVVAWAEPGEDVFRLPGGYAVWRRAESDPHWRVALVERPRRPIQHVDVSTTDVSGDGSDDALVVEGVGGSGACGRWSVIDLLRLERTYSKRLCDGRIEPGPPGAPGLVLTESVFEPGDAHCCPSAIRVTALAWDGNAWRVSQRRVTPT